MSTLHTQQKYPVLLQGASILLRLVFVSVIWAVCLSALPSFCYSVEPAGLTIPFPTEEPDPKQTAQAISRGVRFLIETQNSNGSWGSAQNTRGQDIYAPESSHDAFRAGTTSLVLCALLEIEARWVRQSGPNHSVQTALDIDPERFENAIRKGEQWILHRMPLLRRSAEDALYNVWGHAYGIHALVRMECRFPDDSARREKVRELIASQVDLLRRFETSYGGWFYYDSNKTSPPTETTASFVSATCLLALKEAEQAGISVPEKTVRRAMDSLKRQRLPDFSYLYTESWRLAPRGEINRPAGSLGRSQACNLAMKRWGDSTVTETVLIEWLDRFAARNGWLELGRKKPIPHESFFAIAGYFFYYGQFHAALCVQELEPEKRKPYQDWLTSTLIRLQEKDGSWWDFPLYNYHRSYGTAFSLLTLVLVNGEEK